MSEARVFRLRIRSGGVHPAVYAATDRGLFLYFEDGQDSWGKLSLGLPSAGTVTDLILTEDCVFTAFNGEGVFRSCDILHFTRLGGGLPVPVEVVSKGGGISH